MNRKAFYDALRPTLGALTQANVVGFERYLDEALRRSTALHDLAFILPGNGMVGDRKDHAAGQGSLLAR